MEAKTINIQQTKSIDLQEFMTLLENYPEIVLMQGDKPVARISSLEKKPVEKRQRIAGLHEGEGFWMSDDFNDPLPDEFWLGEDA